MKDHEWETKYDRLNPSLEAGKTLYCNKTERAGDVVQGADFDYCPYCGDKLDEEEREYIERKHCSRCGTMFKVDVEECTCGKELGEDRIIKLPK